MTPQSIQAALGIVLTFAAGILASRGLISKETQAYLVGPETGAFLGVLGAAIIAGIGWYANRAHAQIVNTNKLKQVDAVIVKPKTADEIQTPGVVATLDEAEKVAPTIVHRTTRRTGAQPTAH